jgi:hypothetical protein
LRQDLLCQGQDLFSKFDGYDDVPISVNTFHPKQWSKFLKGRVIAAPQCIEPTVSQVRISPACSYVLEQFSRFFPTGDSAAFDSRFRRQG